MCRCLTDKQGDGDAIYRLFNEAGYDVKNYIYSQENEKSVTLQGLQDLNSSFYYSFKIF